MYREGMVRADGSELERWNGHLYHTPQPDRRFSHKHETSPKGGSIRRMRSNVVIKETGWDTPATEVSGCDSNEEENLKKGRVAPRPAPRCSMHAMARSLPTPARVANRSPI